MSAIKAIFMAKIQLQISIIVRRQLSDSEMVNGNMVCVTLIFNTLLAV